MEKGPHLIQQWNVKTRLMQTLYKKNHKNWKNVFKNGHWKIRTGSNYNDVFDIEWEPKRRAVEENVNLAVVAKNQ